MATVDKSITIDSESECGELVANVGEVTFGKKNREEMKDDKLKKRECETFLRATYALLNSGGGVIKADIENKQYKYNEDGLGEDLKRSLTNTLSCLWSDIDVMQNSDKMLISLKPWSQNRRAVVNTNLYRRNITCTVAMNSTSALDFLRDKKRGNPSYSKPQLPAERMPMVVEERDIEKKAAELFNMTGPIHEKCFDFSESTHVEKKVFATKKAPQRTKEILPRYVSAFANTDGGYLFIHLKGEEKDRSDLEEKQNFFSKMESEIEKSIRRLPVHHFCEEKENIDYSCKFFDVYNERGHCGCACVLRVERFCCAVFAGEPVSWHVKDNHVTSFITEGWVKFMMDAEPGFSSVSEEVAVPLAPLAALRSGPFLLLPVALLTAVWTPGTPAMAWKSPEGEAELTETMSCIPEALCKELFSREEGLERLVENEMGSVGRGRLIFSKSWASDLHLPRNEEVFCEALLISQDRPLVLYTFLRAGKGEDASTLLRELPRLQGCCSRTARSLKQKLAVLGGYTGKLCVTTKMFCLSPEGEIISCYDSSLKSLYPESYYLASSKP